ncbi:tRNA-dihydrouridine synthase [Desulfovibrio sp. JC010]|uniref:tRNA dihydrouridine synthase n=1 Tax=Desulfovibrio sp. JC010 TaxID=2593641 RepID=UPI0013D7C7A8|nr:tRNA-dihydrouridine synthase family protein [Desulfovibrio sp. JC010]NDV26039.1 tRNA-dihydrouridine synthase family protein [Desulfovibrio sp. JC010]
MTESISQHLPELAARLNSPITIGGKSIPNRLWLAPMAGLTHSAFRQALAHYGSCGLMFTEMCSAKAVPTEKPGVSPVFNWHTWELPNLVCQLVGATAEEMVIAAKRVEDEGFFAVDINMGCSARGMIKREAGAALLRTPDKAAEIVEAVREAVSIPVFVKFRTGWSKEIEPAMAMAKRLESAGADCLVFHPRVAPDKRTRPPIIDHIRSIKEAVSIPVFGNGNVTTPQHCLDMLDRTGCDGVSIGRMAMARPWLFAQWTSGFTPDDNIFQDYVLRLADALEQDFDPIRGIKRFRLFMAYFAANFRYGHSLQATFSTAKSMDDVRRMAREHIRPDMELTKTPNMNLYSL